LEALAIEGYRSEALSHFEASQLLGLSRFEFDGFLKERHIYDHAYSVEDLEKDREAFRRLEAESQPAPTPSDSERRNAAVDAILQFAEKHGCTTGGHDLKSMVHEGHKY